MAAGAATMPGAPEMPDMGAMAEAAKAKAEALGGKIKAGSKQAMSEAGKAMKEVQATAKTVRDRYKAYLGFDYFEKNPVEEQRFWQHAGSGLKDTFHGTVTNVLRRGSEASEATFQALDSSMYSIWRPLRHPLQTIFRFDKYLVGGIGRMTVNSASVFNNYLVRPLTKGIHELYQGIWQRPWERLSDTTSNVPVLGAVTGVISKVQNGIGSVLEWPANLNDKFKAKMDSANTWMKDYGKFS